MARLVLVHGAFSGAWIWGPLTDRLKAAGHSVEAFDLPGLGDDHIPASEVTLDACAARLCEVLADSSEPAVVVGNSMGGSCTEDVAAWAIARQRPQPLAPFATPVSIPPWCPRRHQPVLCVMHAGSSYPAGAAATDDR